MGDAPMREHTSNLRRFGWNATLFGITILSLFSACTPGLIGDGSPQGDSNSPNSPNGPSGGGLNGPLTPEQKLQCNTPKPLGETPVRRLSHSEYQNAVADLFAGITLPKVTLLPDAKNSGFENNALSLTPSALLIEQYAKAAEDIAKTVTEQQSKWLPCNPAGQEATCGKQIIETLGFRAFRRPLSTDEVTRYTQFFNQQLSDISFNGALRLTLQVLLQSPQFIYRLEFGNANAIQGDRVPLTGYEMASRLSFFLWESIPDQVLLDSAAADELKTPEQLEKQARRMLAMPRARAAVVNFHRQWLEFERLTKELKDPKKFPSYDDTLKASMMEESKRFVEHHLFDGEGTIQSLLTSSETYVNGPLASFYGVSGPQSANEWQKVSLDPSQRAGILTSANFLASHAHASTGSPPLRGVFVLRNLLCRKLGSPPKDADTSTPEPNPNDGPKTNRQLFEERTSSTVCQSCHQRINGIGNGFEAFDAIGSFRTTDNGLPVDSTGELVGTDVDGPYSGAVELGKKLSESQLLLFCSALNWFKYTNGREETSDDACRVQSLYESLANNQGNLQEMLIATVRSPDFAVRSKIQTGN
jgi:hypothetical protein